MALSYLEYVQLQHLFIDVLEDINLVKDGPIPLSEFNPLSHREIDGDNCLHIAAWHSDIIAIKLLLKGGLDINEKNEDGYTPLDYALSQNNGDVISFLIERGGVPYMRRRRVRDWIKDKLD